LEPKHFPQTSGSLPTATSKIRAFSFLWILLKVCGAWRWGRISSGAYGTLTFDQFFTSPYVA
ncbi:MAG: hypothetical protein WAM98_11290, partial [Terriglobales bacterium]